MGVDDDRVDTTICITCLCGEILRQYNTILVVDDDPDVMCGTSRILKKAGHSVTEPLTGNEGLRAAEEKNPDFNIEYANLALIEKIGRDVNGEKCYQAIHDRDKQCPWCEHAKVMKGEKIKTELL